MKRILFYLLLSFTSLCLFGQNKNIIFRQKYETTNLSEISIKLVYENIEISQTNGEEILIEISSNNTKLVPKIDILRQTLSISQGSSDFSKGDSCTVYIYIPRYFELEDLFLSTYYGNVQLTNIATTNSIHIDMDNGQSTIISPKTKFFKLSVGDALPVGITNLECSYFDVSSLHANIDLSMLKAPLAKSTCHAKYGTLNFSIPKTENCDITAYTTNSTITNNFSKSKKGSKQDYFYTLNNGGAEVHLQTFNGDIFIQ